MDLDEVTAGTTFGAAVDNDQFSRCGTSTSGVISAGGVWYSVVGVGSSLAAALCSDYDTQVSIFSGDCSSLECIGGNDDFDINLPNCNNPSAFIWTTVPGETYYILVSAPLCSLCLVPPFFSQNDIVFNKTGSWVCIRDWRLHDYCFPVDSEDIEWKCGSVFLWKERI